MTFSLSACSDRTLLDYIARPEVAERSTRMTLEQLVDEARRRWLLPIGHSHQSHVDSAWAEYLAERAKRKGAAPGGVILDEQGLEDERKLARARLANELSEATINVLVSRAGQGWPVRDLLILVDDLASIGVISEGDIEEAKAAVFRSARNYAVDGLIKSDHIPF